MSSGRSRENSDDKSRTGIDVLRDLIRENPLEAAMMAFAAGIAEQGDPRLKSLLLQGGMILMKRADAEGTDSAADSDESGVQQSAPPTDHGADR